MSRFVFVDHLAGEKEQAREEQRRKTLIHLVDEMQKQNDYLAKRESDLAKTIEKQRAELERLSDKK